MIKINGPKKIQGSGDYHFFGYYSAGNGIGDGGIRRFFDYFYNSTGNGWGDGYVFGDIKGSGYSYFFYQLKKEFQKK